MSSTKDGSENSECCKVAVTVTNEITKSDALKRKKDLRESRTSIRPIQ